MLLSRREWQEKGETGPREWLRLLPNTGLLLVGVDNSWFAFGYRRNLQSEAPTTLFQEL